MKKKSMKIKSMKINASLNMIKQLCSIIIPLITIPYISRVLGAREYGRYNFSASIVSYFSLFASLGINSYAIREGARYRNDKDRFKKFVSEIFSINVLSTLIAYFCLFITLIYSDSLITYRSLIVAQSLNIILVTLGADWVNTIYEDYMYITIRYVVIQIVSLCLIFLLVKDTYDCLLYSIICVFASSGGNILNFLYIRKYVKVSFTFKMNIKEHIKPILLLFFNSIAVTIYVSSDITILGMFKGDVDVGIYSIAVKIYTVVKQVLNSMIIVALPKLSELVAQNKVEEYKQKTRKILDSLIVFVIPSVVGLFSLRKEIIYFIAGSEYSQASTPLGYLSIALGVTVIAAFYSVGVLMPYKKEGICLRASIISLIVNVVLNLYFIPHYSYSGAALTSLLAEITAFIVYFYESRKIIKINITKNILVSSCIGSLAIFVLCSIIKLCLKSNFEVIILSIVINVVAYFIIQICTGNYLIIEIINAVKRKMP